jgi:hypothetical protein
MVKCGHLEKASVFAAKACRNETKQVREFIQRCIASMTKIQAS